MRTITILSCLLLLGGCISYVENTATFYSDFIDTNPEGLSSAKLQAVPDEQIEAVMSRLPDLEAMPKEERGPAVAKAVAEAREAGEIPPPTADTDSDLSGTGKATSTLGGTQSGRGWVIFTLNQSGETQQDVSAQVEAAVRAAIAANSPNTTQDAGGDEGGVNPDPKPDAE